MGKSGSDISDIRLFLIPNLQIIEHYHIGFK